MDSSIVTTGDMSGEEAELAERDILSNMNDLKEKVLNFYQRKGWAARGYKSFRAWAEACGGKSWQHIYKVKEVALAERNITTLSQNGLAMDIPVKHVTETGLNKLAPLQQFEAYQNAMEMAKAEGRSRVTTAHVKQSVALVQQKVDVFNTRYYVIGHMVTTGDVTPVVGKAMTEALDKLQPKTRGMVVQLIGKFGLTCAELIPKLASDFERPASHPSKTLARLLETGCLADVPLKKSTLTDYEQAKHESARQYMDAAEEKQRQAGKAVSVIVTVYKNDPVRTLKELKRVLSLTDIIELGIYCKVFGGQVI